MEFSGFSIGVSISAVLIVAIIVICVFKKSLKAFINRLRPEKIVHKDWAIYFSNNEISSDIEYSKRLITKDPPMSMDKILQSAEAIVKKDLSKRKDLSDIQKITDVLVPKLAYFQVISIVEFINSYIFGSQIELLAYLNSKNRAPSRELKSFYDKAKKVYPIVYADYPFEKYINFLSRSKLLIQKGEYCRITGLGQFFLAHLIKTNRIKNRPF